MVEDKGSEDSNDETEASGDERGACESQDAANELVEASPRTPREVDLMNEIEELRQWIEEQEARKRERRALVETANSVAELAEGSSTSKHVEEAEEENMTTDPADQEEDDDDDDDEMQEKPQPKPRPSQMLNGVNPQNSDEVEVDTPEFDGRN